MLVEPFDPEAVGEDAPHEAAVVLVLRVPDMVWASPVCTEYSRAFRPAHVGHFMERLPWVDVTYCKYGTPYRKQPTCAGDRAEGCAGAAVGATRGRTGGI